ncbi:MAG: ATP-dependent 6-phosphofructokinase [Chitinophagales bacterium]|nr:MAG: ATP-dependent 6-phosphofructokinase [Chitinophagales bacterium]
MPKIKKIGVFTSGGDAPGMNAAIRAVVRTARYYKLEVAGILRGYEGMIEGEFVPLKARSVSNIIQRGGTILKAGRSKRFLEKKWRRQAYENLKKENIEGVVAIGGDGTFKGALVFSNEFNIPFIGMPGTIDNDLYGTDFTIGYDTAINTAVDAIDKIRDTADSHDRCFFVEVMGRDAGFIALRSGIASGAEAILIPERKTKISELITLLKNGKQRGKTSNIVVVAEGDDAGHAFNIADLVKQKLKDFDIRVVVLGHLQRGGSPTCMDRILASRLGVAAVEALMDGKKNIMVGVQGGKIAYVPFEKATKHHQEVDPYLLRIANLLSHPASK